MTELRHDDGFGGGGDAFYEQLVAAHRGLSDQASGALNARLVLLLANHVGDGRVLAEALRAAREGLDAAGNPPGSDA